MERRIIVKGGRLLFTALMAAGAAAFLVAVLLRRQEDYTAIPYARPKGGEREGGHYLFIGS